MHIYLASFQKVGSIPDDLDEGAIFSAAVYQPKWTDFPKANVWDIRMKDGKWIRPREFITKKNPLLAYRKALMAHYDHRKKKIVKWLENQESRVTYGPDGSIALLCWCPYERAAQRQIKQFGSFVCHLSVVGEWLSTNTEHSVWYDSDRLKMTVLTQKEGSRK